MFVVLDVGSYLAPIAIVTSTIIWMFLFNFAEVTFKLQTLRCIENILL